MTFRAFLQMVACDPLLATEFRARPEAVMDVFGLSGEARDTLRTGDPGAIGELLNRTQPHAPTSELK
jgi:hypothetical protein